MQLIESSPLLGIEGRFEIEEVRLSLTALVHQLEIAASLLDENAQPIEEPPRQSPVRLSS